MTPVETAQIVETAAALFPRVKDDQPTRNAWFLALSRTNFYDAMDALGSLAREKQTVHVSDVAKRAARIRESLLRTLPPAPEPPDDLADDPVAFIAWKKAAREGQLHRARSERSVLV